MVPASHKRSSPGGPQRRHGKRSAHDHSQCACGSGTGVAARAWGTVGKIGSSWPIPARARMRKTPADRTTSRNSVP